MVGVGLCGPLWGQDPLVDERLCAPLWGRDPLVGVGLCMPLWGCVGPYGVVCLPMGPGPLVGCVAV